MAEWEYENLPEELSPRINGLAQLMKEDIGSPWWIDWAIELAELVRLANNDVYFFFEKTNWPDE